MNQNRRLFRYVPAARFRIGAAVVLAGTGGLVLLLEASQLAHIVDGAFIGGKSLRSLIPALWLLLGWIGLRAVLLLVSEYAALQAAARMKSELRLRLARQISELGPVYAKGERSGELVSVLCEGVDQLENYVAKYLPQRSLSAFLPLAVLCMAAPLDWISAGIMAVTLPMLIVFMVIIGQAAKKKADRQFHQLGLLSGHFFDVLRGLPTLILFNRSKAQIEIISRISEKLRTTTMSTMRIAFMSAFVMELFATLSTAVVAVFLGLRLISGELIFYRAFCVLLLVPEFYAPIRQLGAQYHAGLNGMTAAERILQVLDVEPLGWPEQPDGRSLPASSRGYRIEFDRVTVQYPDVPIPVLSEVSFVIEPGERLAIVGPSGAGKSTLLELLQGYIKPASGRILIDGTDMSELSMKWWRSQLAVCEQKPHLFPATVEQNLTLGHPHAAAKDIVRAACMANADGFIRELAHGYETVLSEQAQLSGGQVQRIALARALLKQAPLLVLDEPTDQLDLENGEFIKRSLEQWGRGRTTVLVTHHMDLARTADHIVALQDGAIVASGSHEALMDANGLYASMMNAEEHESAQHRAKAREQEGMAG
ncbi:thiol reductant ABC exporter subunit CydD [Paenibacillus montanisoli]|uniref:Thiol reductant ABC exporter subunit CydD n=1 Tax=Paenibacillus montanisoli TaxID=2081970 RepID=A0A328TXB4_9BACL|nr:thiol reductant ABC exporter subunit CydD [Paenibacillus montanisoli]RAP74203.1 thiol reductant ABC exporter subunit CydD [Paenibacillus montanisoli]